jgi:Protein of unknown function (DUF2550)
VEFLDIAAVLVLLCCLLLLGVVWRRSLLRRRGATVDLCIRDAPPGHGWALGLGRFAGDELEWFRLFSLAPRPRRSLTRSSLAVVDRRRPATTELLSLMTSAVVVACDSPSGQIELAMEDSAVTGFLAWLESAPPGATLPSVPE